MRTRPLDRSSVCALRPLVACLAIALGLEASVSARPASVQTHTATASLADVAPSQPTSVYLVENCDDAGQGSLRDAVNSANMAGVDATIKFDLNTMGCSTISLKTGEIDVTIDNLTIQGPDPGLVTIEGGYSHGYYNRIFKQTGPLGAGSLLHLDHAVLSDAKYMTSGNQQSLGGCIYSNGTVYLANTSLDGCGVFSESAAAKGGGIWARSVKLVKSAVTNASATSQLSQSNGGAISAGAGGLQVIDSSVKDNSAVSLAQNPNAIGGGVLSLGPAVFLRSTVSGNQATTGAGVGGVSIAIANSTIADNKASTAYGGVWAQGTLALYNSTVVSNEANSYGVTGGIGADSIHAVSSVLAWNVARTASGVVESDVSSGDGQITGSHNFIMGVVSGTTAPMDTRSGCPRLAPLLSNGGPTATVGLLPDSPVVDVGYDPYDLGTDQRGLGFDRVVGANADIGAYEWSATSGDEINRNGFELCE